MITRRIQFLTITLLIMLMVVPSVAAGRNNGRQKVAVCHIPPGNPDAAHMISIAQAAVDAHLAHGDNLDTCPDDPGQDPPGNGNPGNGNPGNGNPGNGNPGNGNPGNGNSGGGPGGGSDPGGYDSDTSVILYRDAQTGDWYVDVYVNCSIGCVYIAVVNVSVLDLATNNPANIGTEILGAVSDVDGLDQWSVEIHYIEYQGGIHKFQINVVSSGSYWNDKNLIQIADDDTVSLGQNP